MNKLHQYLESENTELCMNKRNIPTEVKLDLLPKYGKSINRAALRFWNDYANQGYWDSKNKRVEAINQICATDLVVDIMARIAIHKESVRMQVIVGACEGLLAPYLDNMFDRVQTISEIIEVLSVGSLFDIQRIGNRLHITNRMELSDSTWEYINQCQYLPPSLFKPVKILANNQGANLTFNESVLLGKAERHNEEVCLDVINIQNGIEMALSPYMLQFKEKPSKVLPTKDAKKAFKQLRKDSNKAYCYVVENGNSFFYQHNVDSRGRLYNKGYHIAYQSTQYKRALNCFAKLELITGA